MAVQWIDFKELKRSLDFGKVLESYGVSLRIRGDQATGFCPLPTHEGEGKSPSFSANLKRGIWQCFGCGAKGNVLDFAVRMERRSPENPADIREVALKLRSKFGNTGTHVEIVVKPRRSTKQAPPASKPVVVNQPLDFELKGLTEDHPYLRQRGFTPQTVERFRLGYCARGLMEGRIAIPIHSQQGHLLGYAGRLVDDSQISEDRPKYLLPGKRERDGVTHEFRKSLVVYNAHRVNKPCERLIIVEGFAGVWWLTQFGVKPVVALMGASCSPEQAKILVSLLSPAGSAIVMPDGDDAGNRCALSVFETLGTERAVLWAKLRRDSQPTDLSDEQIRAYTQLS